MEIRAILNGSMYDIDTLLFADAADEENIVLIRNGDIFPGFRNKFLSWVIRDNGKWNILFLDAGSYFIHKGIIHGSNCISMRCKSFFVVFANPGPSRAKEDAGLDSPGRTVIIDEFSEICPFHFWNIPIDYVRNVKYLNDIWFFPDYYVPALSGDGKPISCREAWNYYCIPEFLESLSKELQSCRRFRLVCKE